MESKKIYIVIDDATSTKSNMDYELFDTLEAAENWADEIWSHLTDREKEARDALYIGVTEADPEDALEDHDVVKVYK